MEQTPNTDKSLEHLQDRARRMAIRYAEVSPYRLNPDETIWQGVVRAIGLQAQTSGWPYCPCQQRSGDPIEDRKYICPCYRHKEDIAETGHCLCGLFVSQDYAPGEAERPPAMVSTAPPGVRAPVAIYVATWCMHSMRTVRFLQKHDIPYTLFDVEKDPQAAEWVKSQNRGYLSTPTVDVGGRVLTEPSEDELAKALGL